MTTNARVAFSPDQIQARVEELGAELAAAFETERPLLVGILNGSVIFLADLLRNLGVDADIDFLALSSYSGESVGVVRITKDLEFAIEGREVILVEDIVDTGLTLSFLMRTLRDRNPGSLKVCTMIDKPSWRIALPQVAHVGFTTEEFVVGYGLDFKGKYRNLPFLVAVDNPSDLADKPDSLEHFLGLIRG